MTTTVPMQNARRCRNACESTGSTTAPAKGGGMKQYRCTVAPCRPSAGFVEQMENVRRDGFLQRKGKMERRIALMSTKKYQEAYKYMNDAQKDAMYELFESGVNRDDGHVWVTYTDVENAVADIVLAQKGYAEEPKSIAEMTDEELWEEAWKRAWLRFIPGANSWVQLAIGIHRELKEKRDNAQNRT